MLKRLVVTFLVPLVVMLLATLFLGCEKEVLTEHNNRSTFSMRFSGVSIDVDTGEVTVQDVEISSDLSDQHIHTLIEVFDNVLQSTEKMNYLIERRQKEIRDTDEKLSPDEQ